MLARLILCVSSIALAVAGVQAQPAKAPQRLAQKNTKPSLVIVLSIDQFSSDLFAEYRGKVTGGLKRLQQGVVFPKGYQSHAATETCPGHATILTGMRPARSGIIANTWFNPSQARTGKDGKPDYAVYCAEDESIAGSNSSDYVASAVHLEAATLGDRLKNISKESRVVAVAGKDRAALMMGGHTIDQAWWWSKDSFATLVGRDKANAPAGLAAINARAKTLIAAPPVPQLSSNCAGKSVAIPIVGGTVGTLIQRKAGDARALRASPEFDQMTLDLARSIMTEMRLGKGKSTDVLAIGLSATDYIGHTFGTGGAEMCRQIFALDDMLGRFFSAADATGVPYVVVLTADHGGHDLPERNNSLAIADAARVDPALMPKAVGAVIAKDLGLTGDILLGDGPFGDIYVSRDVPEEKRDVVRDAAIKIYRDSKQVEAVVDGEFLAQLPMPTGDPESWTVVDRARASYRPNRSGHLVVLLKPRITPIPTSGLGYVATHGSPWDYDRQVPIMFWYKGIKGFEQPNGVETIDILPTLAPLIGLNVPSSEIDGRCLDLIQGPETSCR